MLGGGHAPGEIALVFANAREDELQDGELQVTNRNPGHATVQSQFNSNLRICINISKF